MFLGEYQHSLDLKGRLILPARFREELPGRAYLTSEVDGCLAVWSHEEFEVRSTEMRTRAKGSPTDRNIARVFFSGAVEVEITGQGRMAIPPHLRQFAGFDKDVVVNGLYDHIEIWDADSWREKKREGERSLAAGDSGTT